MTVLKERMGNQQGNIRQIFFKIDIWFLCFTWLFCTFVEALARSVRALFQVLARN